MNAATDRAERVARRELGFERLRASQREAVEVITGGHDTLAVLPTGSGKSAIYQVAGCYAETSRCRRQYLLNYFAEPFESPCDACDTCRSGRAVHADDEPPIAIGARVRHRDFGVGTVTGFEDGRLTSVYDESGYRTVLADDAISHGTLAVVE